LDVRRSIAARKYDAPTASDGRPDEDAELRAALARLPGRQRTAVFLRYYADLDYEAIGETLGISAGTVAATLNAAHTALRSRLEEVRR
jgi:RNA polymerase sigma factor (sigma-70 family)